MDDSMTLFLLWNKTAGFVGNSPLFWKKGDSGYTPWIDDARVWESDEADKQILSCLGTHDFVKVPVKDVESIAKRTIDVQDLQKVYSDVPQS